MKKVLIIESNKYLSKFNKLLLEVESYIGGSFSQSICEFIHLDKLKKGGAALDDFSFCFTCIDSLDHFNSLNLKWKKPFVVMYNGHESDDQAVNSLLDSSKNSTLNIGSIDFSSKNELFIPLFRRVSELIESRPDKLRERVLYFEKSFNNSLKSIQKISKKIIPLRKEKIKSITVSSKYIAGLNSGGEFLDLKQGENQLIIFLSSTNSYGLSTFFLTLYEDLKRLSFVDHESLNNIIKSSENNLNELLEKPDLKANVGIFVIDLVTYKIWGVNFGPLILKSNMNGIIKGNNYQLSSENFSNSEISMQLKRGERILIVSPGYLKCAKDVFREEDLLPFIESLENKDNSETLSELFFQVKKNNLSSDFLKYDSSILCLEVDTNAIMQV